MNQKLHPYHIKGQERRHDLRGPKLWPNLDRFSESPGEFMLSHAPAPQAYWDLDSILFATTWKVGFLLVLHLQTSKNPNLSDLQGACGLPVSQSHGWGCWMRTLLAAKARGMGDVLGCRLVWV